MVTSKKNEEHTPRKTKFLLFFEAPIRITPFPLSPNESFIHFCGYLTISDTPRQFNLFTFIKFTDKV